MNLIRVNKKYGIIVSSTDYNVCQFRTVKGEKKMSDRVGEEYYTPVSYHGSLQDALNKIVKYTIRDSVKDGDMTLNEAIERIENALNRLEHEIIHMIPDAKVVKI